MGLVISRNLDERTVFIIEPSTMPTVCVVDIIRVNGNKVRLHCDGPPSVKILRNELMTRELIRELCDRMTEKLAGFYKHLFREIIRGKQSAVES